MPSHSHPTALPKGIRRLLDPAALELAPATGEPWQLIRQVLEDGDGDDLCWLVEAMGIDSLRDFVQQRGGRHLSRRSRLFWSLVLEVESAPSHPLAAQLWPL